MFRYKPLHERLVKNIAITGANGFIGEELCKLLTNKGYFVTALVLNGTAPPMCKEVRCDITDRQSTISAMEHADIVVHLAAISNPAKCAQDFDLAYKVNVDGTKNVILASESKRLIFASSAKVYGTSCGHGVCSENDPTTGTSPYAITKILAEILCDNYIWNYGRKINIMRLFNVFGEHQSGEYLIPSIIHQAFTKKHISLRNMNLIRDFLYISDAVEAIECVIEKGKDNHTYNIGSGNGTSLSELVQHIASRMPFAVNLANQALQTDETEKLIADNTKLKQLGWRQRVSVQEGLDKMLSHFRQSGLGKNLGL